ncbi:MAG TPA: hypothetical protein VF113_11355 [Stellaceae bacterium]
MRLHLLLRLLVVAPLAACRAAAPPEAVRATRDEVTFAYGAGGADAAARQAALYCANLGRSARLRAETPAADSRTVATFDCR